MTDFQRYSPEFKPTVVEELLAGGIALTHSL
jgi:transposase-like protein